MIGEQIMNKTKKLVLSAMFLAIGIVLPFLTAQIKEIGDSLLPMHFVVMLCGLICGWKYGAIVGLILPIIRGAFFNMPPLYPNAIWMALEIGTYGVVSGYVYSKLRVHKIWGVIISLISSMIAGRIVWGIAKTVLLGISGKSFALKMFITQGFVDAVPGIILQIVLIPTIIFIIESASKK